MAKKTTSIKVDPVTWKKVKKHQKQKEKQHWKGFELAKALPKLRSGRRRLPTWSARKGGGVKDIMLPSDFKFFSTDEYMTCFYSYKIRVDKSYVK